MIGDLFAGPRGWDEGLRILEHDEPVLGYEVAEPAVATARANGHQVVKCDLLGHNPNRAPETFRGIIASPTCRPFSNLGDKLGIGDLPVIVDTLERMAAGDADAYDQAFWTLEDPRSLLMLVPMRWILEHGPMWVALEQVASVMPAWEAYAAALTASGYSAVAGVLDAADFEVPQHRRRAFMVARRDGEPARLPDPVTPEGHRLHMAPALGWPEDLRELAAFVRSRANDQSGTPYDATWPAHRPSTTIAGRLLVGHPGSNANRFNGSTKSRNDGIRVTAEEAARLQSFPDDYRFVGTEAEVAQMIGDAVPPRLAAHVLGTLVGCTPRPLASSAGTTTPPSPSTTTGDDRAVTR